MGGGLRLGVWLGKLLKLVMNGDCTVDEVVFFGFFLTFLRPADSCRFRFNFFSFNLVPVVTLELLYRFCVFLHKEQMQEAAMRKENIIFYDDNVSVSPAINGLFFLAQCMLGESAMHPDPEQDERDKRTDNG